MNDTKASPTQRLAQVVACPLSDAKVDASNLKKSRGRNMVQKIKAQQNQAKVSESSSSMEVSNTGMNLSRERLAKRAYEIFLERGGQPGEQDDDWFRAERELRLGGQQLGGK